MIAKIIIGFVLMYVPLMAALNIKDEQRFLRGIITGAFILLAIIVGKYFA